jgi:pimeloyl-ACP methyl ester carboxylesterase
LAVDLVGFGQSSKPLDFSYTVEDQARIVQTLLEMLKIQRAILIGHSLGGMIGVLLLNPLRDIISAFVNMEGNLVLSDCGSSREVAKSDFESFRVNGYKQLKNKVKAECSGRLPWLEDIPDYVFYKMSQSIVKLCEKETLLGLFGAASCRRLFLYGDKNHGKISAVPVGVDCRQVSSSGHFMLLDNPEETYACLKDFLMVKQSAGNLDE